MAAGVKVMTQGVLGVERFEKYIKVKLVRGMPEGLARARGGWEGRAPGWEKEGSRASGSGAVRSRAGAHWAEPREQVEVRPDWRW